MRIRRYPFVRFLWLLDYFWETDSVLSLSHLTSAVSAICSLNKAHDIWEYMSTRWYKGDTSVLTDHRFCGSHRAYWPWGRYRLVLSSIHLSNEINPSSARLEAWDSNLTRYQGANELCEIQYACTLYFILQLYITNRPHVIPDFTSQR